VLKNIDTVNKSRYVLIEGSYKASKNGNQKTDDQDGVSSDSEDDMDIAMTDEIFRQDDDETSSSSTNKT
jgi:hypothetical protein